MHRDCGVKEGFLEEAQPELNLRESRKVPLVQCENKGVGERERQVLTQETE